MNILIGTLIFNSYSGSEWYNYELARCLATMTDENGRKLNKVTLWSQTHPETALTGKLRKLGVTIVNMKTEPNINKKFDIVHFSHNPIGNLLLKNHILDSAKFVTTIHSEIINLEFPIINNRISKYISIRPSITDMLVDRFNINPSKIELIYNPIDDTRFNIKSSTNGNYVLFHGSLDYLRREAALDCIEECKSEGLETVFVGRNDYPKEFNEDKMPTCKFIEAKSDISELVKGCHRTAGIMLGRSTIEGYMCGKVGTIYVVDDKGKIISKEITFDNDQQKYCASNVVQQIFNIYKGIK